MLKNLENNSTAFKPSIILFAFRAFMVVICVAKSCALIFKIPFPRTWIKRLKCFTYVVPNKKADQILIGFLLLLMYSERESNPHDF